MFKRIEASADTPLNWREPLYQGEVLIIKANQASLALLDEVQCSLETHLGNTPCWAQFDIDNEQFFEAVGRIRRFLFSDETIQKRIRELVASVGMSLDDLRYDPLKLRAIRNDGHSIDAAKPVYHPHRDTWYANPQEMLTWWIPLADIKADNGFAFLPEYFDAEADNDSEIFDYAQWTQDGQSLRIGWQKITDGQTARFPRALGDYQQALKRSVICQRGDIVIFSGHHLHQTQNNQTDRTRFSVDFRTVDMSDKEQGNGPANVDNRSTGDASEGFMRFE